MDHQPSLGGGGGNKATRFLHTLTGWLHGGGIGGAGSYGAVEGGDDEEDSPACCAAGVKGFVPVYVGASSEHEEELQRFMVKLKHLEHPLFRKLLELREEELGFCDHGKLIIPCDASLFQSVLWHIENPSSSSSSSSNHKCSSSEDVDRLLGSLTSTCVQKHHPD